MRRDGVDHRADEGAELCRLRSAPHRSRTISGSIVGVDDAGVHRVLEVVADVGDAVGPRHDLTLGRHRRRPGPAVVADAVERLDAQVERGQHHIGAPDGVVVAAGDVGGEGVLADAWPPGPWPQSWPRAIASVSATLRPTGPGDRRGDLGHLERVGEAGALVVLGKDEHLRLAGQAAEGRGAVQDAVAVAFEAGAERVGLLGPSPVPGALGERGAAAERPRLASLVGLAVRQDAHRNGAVGVGVCVTNRHGVVDAYLTVRRRRGARPWWRPRPRHGVTGRGAVRGRERTRRSWRWKA